MGYKIRMNDYLPIKTILNYITDNNSLDINFTQGWYINTSKNNSYYINFFVTEEELSELENLKKKLDGVLYKTGNITSTNSLLIGNSICQKHTFVLNYRFKKQEFEKIQALLKLQGFLKN